LHESKFLQAETLLRPALSSYEKRIDRTWRRYNCESMLGASLAGQAKYVEAESSLLAGYQGMLDRESTIPAANHIDMEQAGQWIVQLYRDWGRPEEVSKWKQKLQAAKISTR